MKKIVSIALVLIFVIAIFFVYLFFQKKDTSTVPLPPLSKEKNREESKEKGSTLIIAFGDSLTAGYGLPLPESYPSQLEEALLKKGYTVKVINAGVSGETTKGNSERANFIASQNPNIALLGIGGNDALRALPLDETEKNMRKTIEILKSASSSPRVYLLQMQAPLNGGLEYKKSFDALYPKLAKEFSLPLVPFITESLFGDKKNVLPDGIHLNKRGYSIFVNDILVSEVELFLKK